MNQDTDVGNILRLKISLSLRIERCRQALEELIKTKAAARGPARCPKSNLLRRFFLLVSAGPGLGAIKIPETPNACRT